MFPRPPRPASPPPSATSPTRTCATATAPAATPTESTRPAQPALFKKGKGDAGHYLMMLIKLTCPNMKTVFKGGKSSRQLKIILFLSPIEDMEENSMRREAKALLYWVTTTSTFTWYTSTSTIATIECTPSGFTISQCYSGR